jgi:hypothetical protein
MKLLITTLGLKDRLTIPTEILNLKVPSGQIRSACSIIAKILASSSTAVCFKICHFSLEFFILVQSSEPLNMYKNASNLLILRQAACKETFLPICWRTLFNEKSVKVPRKPSFAPVVETPSHPLNIKFIVPAFFRDWFVAREGAFRTHNPSAEEV